MSAHFARPHRHEALDRLADRRLLRDLGYVGGHWTAGRGAASCDVTELSAAWRFLSKGYGIYNASGHLTIAADKGGRVSGCFFASTDFLLLVTEDWRSVQAANRFSDEGPLQANEVLACTATSRVIAPRS